MRNMFGIFKISLFGIFVLLISQQTYAQCEEELNRISVTDTQIAKYSQVSGKTFTKNQYHELVKSGVYPDVDFSFSVGFSTIATPGIEDPQKRTRQLRSNESYSIILKKLQDKYATPSPSENYGKPVPTKDIYNYAAVQAYLNCMDNSGARSNSSSTQYKGSTQTQQSQNNNSNQSQSSDSQQSQQLKQRAQESQQQAQQNQQRADQDRKGKRRRHEPENEASHCIQPDFGGLYGGMKNTCNFKVWYTYCGYRPTENSWLRGMNCEKQSFGSDSVSPGRTSAAHTKGVQMLYWFACKEPAWTVDTEFVAGSGIRGRCHTVGGN